MFPKARLDALHDGIFSVAMTLLVLDIRLPDELHPRDGAELMAAIGNLWPKFLPYLLSFTVLGLRWLASVEIRSRAAAPTSIRGCSISCSSPACLSRPSWSAAMERSRRRCGSTQATFC